MADTGSPPLTFTHTRLLVENYRECFRFYRDVLGFEVGFGDADSGYADFRTGETTLALFERAEMVEAVGTGDAPPADPDPGDARRDEVALILRVDSVDGAFDRLRSEADFVTEPQDRSEWGIRVAHLRDPDGTLLEINEPLDEA